MKPFDKFLGLCSVSEWVPPSSGNFVPVHEAFGPVLVSLNLGGCLAGAKAWNSFLGQHICDSVCQGVLRPHNHQPHWIIFAKGDHCVEIADFYVGRDHFLLLGNSNISGGHKNCMDLPQNLVSRKKMYEVFQYTFGELASFQQRACSRPPQPTTSTLLVILL